MTDPQRSETDFAEYADPFPWWPGCETPDCGNKQCTWADFPLCFRCGERALGHDEMVRRYNATHDITWEEAIALEASDDDTGGTDDR
jgi:hypothetical protein